jgi:hypothetical protein
MRGSKKPLIWFIVFVILVALTLFTIISQSKNFSIDSFGDYIASASWQWIVLAFLGMLGFIVFEGLAILVICRAFGYRRKIRRGLVYSVTDIYFSAITPSATGGQPASAYFMMKDKIPAAVTTIVLLINLTFYTTSLIVVGVVCFLMEPGIFGRFSPFSKVLILAGFILQFVLMAGFLLLVYKEKIVTTIVNFLMRILSRLHLLHNIEKKQERLKHVEEQYKECAMAIKDHKRPLAIAWLFNFLQRVSQILVSVFIYLGIEGNFSKVSEVFATQGFVALGSNSVPIPGAVGAADYLFIDGFSYIVNDPVSIELLSRGISFYCCVILCGIATFAIYLADGWKGMKRKKK